MSRILKFEVPPGKPILRGQDHFWRVTRDLDQQGPWSVSDVLGRCGGGVERSTVRDFIRRLVAGEVAARDEGSPDGTLYRLLKAPIATPRLRRDGTVALQGRGQTAMWNMIRGPLGREGFTPQDVALYASTETVAVAPATAASYVKHLAQAGYLLRLPAGRPGSGRKTAYRLKPAMHTGPLPPLILRTQIVFDQNRGEAVGPVEAREVAP